MKLLLMSLAAGDVYLIANRASPLGIEIESLTVEASGHFNLQRYLGVDAEQGPGYQRVACRVRLQTKGASPSQIAELRTSCERGSPVGNTLERSIAPTLDFEVT
ncbi:MAG: OsmC family protein [Actinomycetota bacterium]